MLLEHSTLAPLSGLLAEELERGDDGAETGNNSDDKTSDAPEGGGGGEGSSSDKKDDRAAAGTFQSLPDTQSNRLRLVCIFPRENQRLHRIHIYVVVYWYTTALTNN